MALPTVQNPGSLNETTSGVDASLEVRISTPAIVEISTPTLITTPTLQSFL
ncbi:hypothetical protein CCACVL1_18190, partial [Corchorus capsularis]